MEAERPVSKLIDWCRGTTEAWTGQWQWDPREEWRYITENVGHLGLVAGWLWQLKKRSTHNFLKKFFSIKFKENKKLLVQTCQINESYSAVWSLSDHSDLSNREFLSQCCRKLIPSWTKQGQTWRGHRKVAQVFIQGKEGFQTLMSLGWGFFEECYLSLHWALGLRSHQEGIKWLPLVY